MLLIFFAFCTIYNNMNSKTLAYRRVDRLIDEIKGMDDYAKLDLLEKLVKPIKRPPGKSRKTRSILELKGLGKEVWEGVDVEEYIRKERDSWD